MSEFTRPDRLPGEDPMDYGRRVRIAKLAWTKEQRGTVNGAGTKPQAERIAGEARPKVEEVTPPGDPDWRDLTSDEPVDLKTKGRLRAATTQLSFMIRGFFNLLAMGLGLHWRLTEHEVRDLTQATYSAIIAQPKHRQARLLGALMAWTPNVFLAATVVTILTPRILQTQYMLRARAQGRMPVGSGPRPVPLRQEQPRPQPVPQPQPQPSSDETGAPRPDTAPAESDIQEAMG